MGKLKLSKFAGQEGGGQAPPLNCDTFRLKFENSWLR